MNRNLLFLPLRKHWTSFRHGWFWYKRPFSFLSFRCSLRNHWFAKGLKGNFWLRLADFRNACLLNWRLRCLRHPLFSWFWRLNRLLRLWLKIWFLLFRRVILWLFLGLGILFFLFFLLFWFFRLSLYWFASFTVSQKSSMTFAVML